MTGPDTTEPRPGPRTISGRAVVIGMFLFAGSGIAVLQFYWDRHLEPFMPLQKAIAEEFDNSSPRVDGGQRKMSKSTPRVLRVVMRVPFDPEDPENKEVVRTRISAVAKLAVKHASLGEYGIFTTHFYQENPGRMRQKTFETPVAELTNRSDTNRSNTN